ncbi:MAG: hypothetical protein ACO4B3_05985 [Planctomycetota bacterium]
MKKLTPRMAAAQLLFCILVTIVLGIFAIVASDPPPAPAGSRSAWTLAQSAAAETFSARGLQVAMEQGIVKKWNEQLAPNLRRKVLLAEAPREGRTVVGTIRVVEFLGGQTYIQLAEGGVPQDPTAFFNESWEKVELEEAVLEATTEYIFYVLWKESPEESPLSP